MASRRQVHVLLLALAVAGTATALFLALRPDTSHGAGAPGITARAVPANPGPVHACDPTSSSCPLDTWEQIPLYAANGYPLVNWENQPGDSNARWAVPNAFDVSSIDVTATVNGVPYFGPSTYTPPPNSNLSAWAGHWPSTVRCDPNDGSNCHVAGTPAVLPGEKTVALYFSWIHAADEPDGKYVFTFTIHGTVNGTPMDLTASTRGVKMTR